MKKMTILEGKEVIINFDKEYASQVMDTIPRGYVDKVVCAIGLTSLGLENSVPTILMVPTVQLATTKAAQYPCDRSDKRVFAVDASVSPEQIAAYVRTTPVIKILCVYDSAWKMLPYLDQCHLVIDESDRLLAFTKLKQRDGRNVINELIGIAEKYKDTVSFISATPTPIKHFSIFPWMKEMDQVTLKFPNIRKVVPILCDNVNPTKFLQDALLRPLMVKGACTLNGVTFTKAIVFLNSVTDAVSIAKELDIPKENVGMICGDNMKNDLRITRITRLTGNYNNLPKLTFVTSSGWEGIDIYDEEAITIVVSSVKKKFMMVDYLTDLKQAVSRQRIKINPHYNRYIFVYNKLDSDKSIEKLKHEIEEVSKDIDSSIWGWHLHKEAGKLNGWGKVKGVDEYTIMENGELVRNKLAFEADSYRINVVYPQHLKGFDTIGQFDNSEICEAMVIPRYDTYRTLVKYFQKNHVKGVIDWGKHSTRTGWIIIIETSYKLFGKVWTNIVEAEENVKNFESNEGRLRTMVKFRFRVGSVNNMPEYKAAFTGFYRELGMTTKAKGTDILKYMNVKKTTVRGDERLEILSVRAQINRLNLSEDEQLYMVKES